MLSHDIFVNVAGGFRVTEPAADLGIVAALVSAFRDKPLPHDAVFFGEVGLAGEVRSVSRPDARLAEARELGFLRAFVPGSTARTPSGPEGFAVHGVARIEELVDVLWG